MPIALLIAVLAAVVATIKAINYNLAAKALAYCYVARNNYELPTEEELNKAKNWVVANQTADLISKFSRKSREEILFEYYQGK